MTTTRRPAPAALALALALLAPGPARAEDRDEEAFARRLTDLIEKTVAEAEDAALDRTSAATLDVEDRELAETIERRFDRQRITLRLDATSFEDSLEVFRQTTGWNIVVDGRAQTVIDEVGPKISLRLKDVKLRSAFELLLDQTDARLRYKVQHGVLAIGTLEEWKGKDLILDIIPVDDLLNPPPDFPGPDLGLDILSQKRAGRR